jgi:ribonucleotide reductase alpha subunit
MILKLPFVSTEAKELNKKIHEVIYYSLLYKSNELAQIYGPYNSYENSPVSQGLLQMELWGYHLNYHTVKQYNNLILDWPVLRENIKKYGIYNSLLTASMPTASSASILGNNESIEPITSNIYTRSVLSGTYIMINKYLINDLKSLGLWDENMKKDLISNYGSIQNIDIIPVNLKEIYKTSWEMSMKDIIDMSADRALFIDQSQSLNLFVEKPTYANISSMHFYSWKKGLKTGMYYLRSKPASQAIQFTLDKQVICKLKKEDNENCLVCSS